MFAIHGTYHFKPKRLAFRNDYCLRCGQPRRAVQVRTFDVWHIFWIPVLPLGFWKPWICTVCGGQPHITTKTRRPFKWAGVFVLLVFSAAFWAMPVEPEEPDAAPIAISWVVRIGGPLGAILVLIHLLRSPRDPSLKERLAGVQPASDTSCPFCGAQLLMLASQCSCPVCGVVRF